MLLIMTYPESEKKTLKALLNDILAIPGVVSYSEMHFWSYTEEDLVLTMKVFTEEKANSV